jgi:para-nitrobenzyl esterase
MATPLAKGLFERVIAESGSVVPPGQTDFAVLREAESSGEKLAARWNVPPGASLEAMRALSTADILKADPDYMAPNAGHDPVSTWGVIDGYVFPESPIRIFMQGKEHRVALLHGNNSRDADVFGLPQDLYAEIDGTYGPLGQQARKLYAGAADPVYGLPVNQWVTDTGFRCPAVGQLLWHSSAGNPSYQYEFARALPGLESTGAFHSQEIAYVSGTLARVRIPPPRNELRPTNAVDKQIPKVMQQYWTNFAKTGDPNGAGLPLWPQFDPSSRAYIQFTDAGPIA